MEHSTHIDHPALVHIYYGFLSFASRNSLKLFQKYLALQLLRLLRLSRSISRSLRPTELMIRHNRLTHTLAKEREPSLFAESILCQRLWQSNGRFYRVLRASQGALGLPTLEVIRWPWVLQKKGNRSRGETNIIRSRVLPSSTCIVAKFTIFFIKV